MRTLALTFLALLAIASPATVAAQSKTYPETRKLLLKMDYSHLDGNFKKLFEEAIPRKPDLIHALYDDEKRICLNAQIVMKSLAEPEMLAAINEWFDYRKKLGKDYWWPPIELTSDVKYLKGNDDPPRLVLKNLYPGQKDVSAKLVAYNRDLKTAMVEVVFGEVFTEGRHVAIRNENGKWRLLSESLSWQS